MKKILSTLGLITLISTSGVAADINTIQIVGSSTVFPFTAAVAEKFGKSTSFKTPIVESTGTGGGIKLFCSGVGMNHPDLVNASRAIVASERALCEKNGVKNAVEFKIGYDGIVLAGKNSPTNYSLTSEVIWRALAKQVPVNGTFVNNPYKTWRDIDASLPNTKIEVLGPPPTSGTRDSFVELVLTKGCSTVNEVKILPSDRKKVYCETIREDGAFIEAGENDNLIVQKLVATPNALGVFGFSYYDQNRDKLIVHNIDGVEATIENISSGKYSASRELFVYIKADNIAFKPGLKEFLREYAKKSTIGDDGYLVDKGLIPLHSDELNSQIQKIRALAN